MITLKEALELTVTNENEPIYIRIDHKYGWERLTAKQVTEKFSVKRTKVKYIRPYLDDGYATRFSGMEFVLENKDI